MEKLDMIPPYESRETLLTRMNESREKTNEIIDWINNYEGAKEQFRQKLLSGNLAGLKMDEKQMEIVKNAEKESDARFIATGSLQSKTPTNQSE